MKKIIVLLIAGLATTMGAHALTQPESPITTQNNAAPPAPQPLPAHNEAAKEDLGSGDDIDTADPANDKDPEADDTSPANAPSS